MSGTTLRGKIAKVSEAGFGFIKPDNGGQDMYFHAKGMADRSQYDSLKPGDAVTYEVTSNPDRDNRPRAVNVKKTD